MALTFCEEKGGGMTMWRTAAVLLTVWSGAVQAQDLRGSWQGVVTGPDGTRFDIGLTLGELEFAVQVRSTVPQGFVYDRGFRGSVFYIEPDQIHLVVVDWDPKFYEGAAQARPPDSTYTILEITTNRLVLRDNLCAATSDPAGCITTYDRSS
jgi:hypothetical protein